MTTYRTTILVDATDDEGTTRIYEASHTTSAEASDADATSAAFLDEQGAPTAAAIARHATGDDA